MTGRGRVPRRWHPDEIVNAYLVAGERKVLEETRSVRAWVIDQLVWIIGGLVVFVLLASLGPDWSVGLGFLVVLGLGVFLAVRGAQAWFTRYVITDLRVLRVTGVFNRHAEFIPWAKVTDIARSESLLQWMAGTATIRIESANERSGFRAMDDVEDPARFYRVLVRMVDLRQGRVGDASLID
jgi:uncharacterized membrane protein YdbT with pleckstrin-like domain